MDSSNQTSSQLERLTMVAMCQLMSLLLVQSASDAIDTARIDAAVLSEMKEQKLVGVAVGIIRDGKIVYTKAYGEADRAAKTPATDATAFNWASNSKPLAAVLALQLVEKGLLDLDADVRQYVPEFPKKEYTITVRHLLTHQSGIPHYVNGKVLGSAAAFSETDPALMDPLKGIERFDLSPLLFAPGTKTSYSSYAYVLLSAVIQRAGKKPFAEQVKERITDPLNMKSFEWDAAKAKPAWATGYVLKNGEAVPAAEEANAWKHGAGGFKSDIRDFARWAQALINHELMKPETEKLIWTMQPLKDKTATDYSLGFRVSRKEPLVVSHNGSQSETKTRMVLVPGEKRGIVIMSNCNHANVDKLAAAVEAALAKK